MLNVPAQGMAMARPRLRNRARLDEPILTDSHPHIAAQIGGQPKGSERENTRVNWRTSSHRNQQDWRLFAVEGVELVGVSVAG